MSAVFSAIGNALSSVVKAVGSAVQWIGNTISSTIQSAMKNPIATIAKVAAYATGQLWAIPLIDAATVVANGGSIGQALIAGAASAVGQWVGAGAGMLEGGIAGQFGNQVVGSAVQQAVSGGVTAAIRGQDIATGALAGAAGSLVGSAFSASPIATTLGATTGAAAPYLYNALTSGVKGGVSNLIRGRDFGAGFVGGATGSIGSSIGSAASDRFNQLLSEREQLQNDAQEFQNVAQEYQDTYAGAQELEDRLTAFREGEYREGQEAYLSSMEALEQVRPQAEEASNNLNAAADAYNAKQQELTELNRQYDDAVARNDVEEANRLADVMNGIAETEMPELHRAYEEANAAYEPYRETHQNVIDAQERMQELTEQGTSMVNQLTEDSRRLEEMGQRGQQMQQDIQARGDAYRLEEAALINREAEARRHVATGGYGAEEFLSEHGAGADADTARAVREAEVTNPWDEHVAAGIQRFDDGSSVQVFDDGSMIVTDSDGNAVTYDEEGNIYEPGSNEYLPENQGDRETRPPQTAPQTGKGIDWMRALRSSVGTRRQAAQRTYRQAASRVRPTGAGAGAAPAITPIGMEENIPNPLAMATAEEVTGNKTNRQKDILGFIGASPTKLSYIEGAPQMIGKQEYVPLDPHSKEYQAYAAKQKAEQERNESFENANSGNLASLDPLSNPYDYSDSVPSATGAGGGQVKTRNSPLEFLSEGGMSHVRGDGDGVSDSIHALLSDGEYVIPARVVSELGNGSSDAGAKKLDNLVKTVDNSRKRMKTVSDTAPDYLSNLLRGA